ncbi:hypothetical protein [Burkholderia territorii]|uniref:hypothetical protein n=1 Tax=Burkholderia territorii TaxID=1503055 RepID=UPI0012D9A295|nr:hypothetical protein [Burkholderia territorii]
MLLDSARGGWAGIRRSLRFTRKDRKRERSIGLSTHRAGSGDAYRISSSARTWSTIVRKTLERPAPAFAGVFPDQRHIGATTAAVGLWTKAAERERWNAMFDPVNACAQGEAVARASEHAVQVAEGRTKPGIPTPCDPTGKYYVSGEWRVACARRGAVCPDR